MGFFSGNYYKEGPGVKKNERQKKEFFTFFEIYIRNFWKLFGIGFIYSAISVLTLGIGNGLAKAGMTHVVRSMGRQKHSFGLSDFFDTIKKNWKQSLILGFVNVVLMAVLALDIWYFWGYISNTEELAVTQILGLGVSLSLLIVVTFIKYYIWTMTITFSLTIKQMVKNAFHFSFLNVGRNILIAVVMGLVYAGLYTLATVNGGFFVIAAILLACVVPGFKMSLVHANVFPSIKKYIIDPYYAEHKGEDIEKRRALGLEIDDDEIFEPQEESLFTDTVSDDE